jgi:predicted ATPase
VAIGTRPLSHHFEEIGIPIPNAHRLKHNKHCNCLHAWATLSDFALLEMVFQDSSEEIHRPLWEAVRMGLIFRSEDSYKFLHDRVQEAAYFLIPDESRAKTHLRIGKLLIAHSSPEKLEEGIFEIVNQLNRATALITAGDERIFPVVV